MSKTQYPRLLLLLSTLLVVISSFIIVLSYQSPRPINNNPSPDTTPIISPTPQFKNYSNPSKPFTFSYPSHLEITEGDTTTLSGSVIFSLHRLSSANEFNFFVQSQANKINNPITGVEKAMLSYPALGFIEDPGSANIQHIYLRPNDNSTTVVSIRYSTGFDYIVLPLLSTLKLIDEDILDFSVCPTGKIYQMSHGLGSFSLSVKDSTPTYCHIEFTNEIEGGYSVNSCAVPKTTSPLTLTFPNTQSIMQYCKQLKSGNVFLR